jgi:thymidine kinase
MSKSGTLELIIGPMFSGKSSELIKKIRILKIINSSYIIIKPIIDNRYDKNHIVTHNKESEECIIVDDLKSINDSQINNYNTIFIDEGQFLKNLKNVVLYWVEELNKNVIISGLDGDFQRNPIGEILDLIPYADKYKKLSALCTKCKDGTFAIFSHRLANNTNDQVLIGSTDLYEPLCRNHYLLANK